jgi:hypothetical protein
MTVDQIFENAGTRKTVWTKRGDTVSKRDVSAVSSVKPRVKIETVKEGRKS